MDKDEDMILPVDNIMKVIISVNKENAGFTFNEMITMSDGTFKNTPTNEIIPIQGFCLLATDQWTNGRFNLYTVYEYNAEDRHATYTDYLKNLTGTEDEQTDYCQWIIKMENDPIYSIEHACALLNTLAHDPKQCLIDLASPKQTLALRYTYDQIEKNSGISMSHLNNSLMMMLGYEVKQNRNTFVYKKGKGFDGILDEDEVLFYALSVALSIAIVKEDIIQGSKQVDESMMENETEQVFDKHYPDYHVYGPGLLIREAHKYYKGLIESDSDRYTIFGTLTNTKQANKLSNQVKKMLNAMPEGLTMNMTSIGDMTSFLHKFPSILYTDKMLTDPDYGISQDPATITYIISIIISRFLLKKTNIMSSGEKNNVPALMTGLLFAKTIADMNKYAHNPNELKILLSGLNTDEVKVQTKTRLESDIKILNNNINNDKDKIVYTDKMLTQELEERASIYKSQIDQFSLPTQVEQRNNSIKEMYAFLNTIGKRCIEYTTEKPVPEDYNIATYLDVDIDKVLFTPETKESETK